MASVGTTLELRCIAIPRTRMALLLERELGRPLSHEFRHFLGDQPVYCGMLLECWIEGRWTLGRYEWSCRPEDMPTFHVGDRELAISSETLLRWPA
jgi:hypothetical protein